MRLDTLRRSDPGHHTHESAAATRPAWHRVACAITALLVGAITITPSVNAQQPDATATDSIARGPACTACIHGPHAGLSLTAGGLAPDTTRRKAIEYSDEYATRLTIHRIASYAELPLFGAEYVLGQKLLNEEAAGPLPRGSSLRTGHNLVADGLGLLFLTNTVTGVWNLIDSRKDPAGATRRWLHSLTMLAADAGFFWTASVGGQARRTLAGANQHRNIAIGSMSLATVSTLMMWLWKD
jgi:hypothetical protein